jgi:hypothetical protein
MTLETKKGSHIAVLCLGVRELNIEICVRLMLIIIKNLDAQKLLIFILIVVAWECEIARRV